MHSIRHIGFVVAMIGLSAASFAAEPSGGATGIPTGGTNQPAGPGTTGTTPTSDTTPTRSEDAQARITDDGQIVGMLNAVSKAEIDEAKYVLGKTHDPEVKRFAQSMIDDHTAMTQKTGTWSKSAGIKPAESRVQTDFTTMARQDLQRWTGLSGEELDRHYIQHQAMRHQKTLDLVDTQMMREVEDPALKTLLRDTRPKLQHHLEMAQTLRTSMGGALPDDDMPATPTEPDTTNPNPSPNPIPPAPTPTPTPNPTPNPSGY